MDIVSALPIDGAAGRMLAAAIRAGDDGAWSTVVDLSRAAGLNRVTGARAHARLVEAGAITEDESRWWVLDRSYPYLDLATEIVKQVTGPLPPEPDRDPWDLSRLPHPKVSLDPGPTAVEASRTMGRLHDLAGALFGLEQPLQDVYAFTKNERARDLIHQLIGRRLGYDVDIAAACLDRGLRLTEADLPAHQVTIGISAWTQALEKIVSEATRTEAMTQWLLECIQTGRQLRGHRHRLLGDLSDHLDYISASTPDDPRTATFKATQEATRIEGMTRRLHQHRDALAEARGELHQVGGSPHYEDVGALADQLLAANLRRFTCQLLETAHEMAEHPAYLEWAEHHPTNAVNIPVVPDRTLTRLKDDAS